MNYIQNLKEDNMKSVIIQKKEGLHSRSHEIGIVGDLVYFDTADGEYGLGKISLKELKEKIQEYENRS